MLTLLSFGSNKPIMMLLIGDFSLLLAWFYFPVVTGVLGPGSDMLTNGAVGTSTLGGTNTGCAWSTVVVVNSAVSGV